jgi:crossover junction endodeoxyribonuclease RuvC
LIILGIDPGLATVGYGVITYDGRCACTDYGTIKTPKGKSLAERLVAISCAVEKLIDTYCPDAVAIEEIFFNTNAKTAINVSHARGVIICMALRKGCKLYEYTPLQIKQGLTGYGRADKRQVQHMVAALLSLKSLPRPDDAADALAVALCHIQTNRFSELYRV